MQLLLLHIRSYQILLVFWYVLFASVQGSFMQRFGARYLFLYPEYLNKVNFISTMLIGMAFGVFLMCWNITTFILHSKHFKFLAATTQPFLKYCINNSPIPISFLIFYGLHAVKFLRNEELSSTAMILILIGGFIFGLFFILLCSFFYFFGADKTIYRALPKHSKELLTRHRHGGLRRVRIKAFDKPRIDWYISATFKLRQPRKVSHYSPEFLDRIFSQHHLAAVFSVLVVFVTLLVLGFLQDYTVFQFPSAGSVMVLFGIAIAVAGAVSLFLRAWAIVAALAFLVLLNTLHKQGILDPRNKAYGLAYTNQQKPLYTPKTLRDHASPANITRDSLAYISILNNWKARQQNAKPLLVLTAVSGGGSRAAIFAMHILRQADSLTNNAFTNSNALITGASGGMMGAAFYRELLWQQQSGKNVNAQDIGHIQRLGRDLLNPIFSSLLTRDLLAPVQHVHYAGQRYIKDRGYVFEETLNRNTYGFLNKPVTAYKRAEALAQIPSIILSAVITRDGRRVIISNHPARFLIRPTITTQPAHISYPDGIDLLSFQAGLQPDSLRFLSALRMNATFPYILPNVWLPTSPVVDVMDAGFRDNTGLETVMRFLSTFKAWIDENCSGVLLVQVRDKPEGGWQYPYESRNMFGMLTRPALLTQNNLFRFQEFAQLANWNVLQHDFGSKLQRLLFEYVPDAHHAPASLSFHLTQREKIDIAQSLQRPNNAQAFSQLNAVLAASYKDSTSRRQQ